MEEQPNGQTISTKMVAILKETGTLEKVIFQGNHTEGFAVHFITNTAPPSRYVLTQVNFPDKRRLFKSIDTLTKFVYAEFGISEAVIRLVPVQTKQEGAQ